MFSQPNGGRSDVTVDRNVVLAPTRMGNKDPILSRMRRRPVPPFPPDHSNAGRIGFISVTCISPLSVRQTMRPFEILVISQVVFGLSKVNLSPRCRACSSSVSRSRRLSSRPSPLDCSADFGVDSDAMSVESLSPNPIRSKRPAPSKLEHPDRKIEIPKINAYRSQTNLKTLSVLNR